MTIIRNDVDVLLSFDSTGSMSPCIRQVRQDIKSLAKKLWKEIPGIRIALSANGDYCDKPPHGPYVTKFLDFTTDVEALARFVDAVEPTGGGGNGGEAYELVFHEAQQLRWEPKHRKAMVLVADEIPHTPQYTDYTHRTATGLNWRNEVEKLCGMGVKVYGVQALNHPESRMFYPELARMTGGFHIRLDQFSYITEVLLAIGLQHGETMAPLEAYETEVKAQGRYNRNIANMFDTLLNRKTSTADALYGAADGLKLVAPGRFQMMRVDKDSPIAEFVKRNGLPFKIGRGFYQFTKTETIQGRKEIVLADKASGDMYTGQAARDMLSLPDGASARLKPAALDKYHVFVQSTSANRKLIGGTNFLYEVQADW